MIYDELTLLLRNAYGFSPQVLWLLVSSSCCSKYLLMEYVAKELELTSVIQDWNLLIITRRTPLVIPVDRSGCNIWQFRWRTHSKWEIEGFTFQWWKCREQLLNMGQLLPRRGYKWDIPHQTFSNRSLGNDWYTQLVLTAIDGCWGRPTWPQEIQVLHCSESMRGIAHQENWLHPLKCLLQPLSLVRCTNLCWW